MRPGPVEPPVQGTGLSREVVAEIGAVCRQRVARFRGLSHAEQEDAAQLALTRVIEAIQQGHVTNVASFARRVAFHCAVDAWRRIHGEDATAPEPHVADGEVAGPPSSASPNPEALSVEKRRVELLTRIEGQLRALLDEAPDNYRRVIIAHYFEGRSLDALARDELARRGWSSGEDDAGHAQQLQRARDAVHAWHSRALRWLQARAPSEWRELLP